MAELSDTTPEAARVQCDVFRRMSSQRKWMLLGEIDQNIRALHAAGYRHRHPLATTAQIRQNWMAIVYNWTLPTQPNGRSSERSMSNIHELREVLAILTQLGIPYALGGSMASSYYGVPRSTHDADVTVEPFPRKESELVAAFGDDYYVNESAVRQAVLLRSSFNIINAGAGFKVDVFVRKDRPFEQSAMSRRVAVDVANDPAQPVFLYTPEDVVLFKLAWYRLGNQASEHQIKDVLGVLQVQAGRLDDAYLDHWAADLGVADLLARARRESAL